MGWLWPCSNHILEEGGGFPPKMLPISIRISYERVFPFKEIQQITLSWELSSTRTLRGTAVGARGGLATPAACVGGVFLYNLAQLPLKGREFRVFFLSPGRMPAVCSVPGSIIKCPQPRFVCVYNNKKFRERQLLWLLWVKFLLLLSNKVS